MTQRKILRISERIRASEYRAQAGIENLTFVDGMAVNSEDELCIACVRWWDRVVGDRYGMIHIPNGGSRDAREGAKFKRMGVRAGTPDYLIQKDGIPVGWLEFKWGKNGLSPTQKEFKEYAHGFRFAEVRNFADFRRALSDWGIYARKKDFGE